MNARRMFLTAMAMIVGLTGLAGASVVFSDDFTGTDGSPVDPAKWVAWTDGGTVTIQVRSGRTIHGTVAWDGFDTETTAVLAGGDFVVLRSSEIESFAWTPAAAPTA